MSRFPSLKIKWQKGISLLEVFLSLSIIAVILIMATRYFYVASTRNKINVTVSQIGGVIAATEMWRGTPGTDLGGLTIQTLYDNGLLVNFPGLNANDTKNVALNTMWGDQIQLQGDSSDKTKAEIVIPLPSVSVCNAIEKAYPKLDADTSANECSSSAPYNFTYDF